MRLPNLLVLVSSAQNFVLLFRLPNIICSVVFDVWFVFTFKNLLSFCRSGPSPKPTPFVRKGLVWLCHPFLPKPSCMNTFQASKPPGDDHVAKSCSHPATRAATQQGRVCGGIAVSNAFPTLMAIRTLISVRQRASHREGCCPTSRCF